MALTLGRRKNKDKKKSFHSSCQNLTLDEDCKKASEMNQGFKTPTRPDSGYEDDCLLHVGQSSFERQMLNVSQNHLEPDFTEVAMKTVNELIQSEENYIDSLKNINAFFAYMEKSKAIPAVKGIVSMPSGLADGKDRILFGNSRALLDFHQGCILPELRKIKTVEDVHHLQDVFRKRKDTMKEKYGKFCINLSMAQYIFNEFQHYLNVSFFIFRARRA